ncbi:MAG TPA: glycosyltransferase family 61 protein [Rhabdochlamydiaceae bacterium]|nr:glycosyltransferase family 61 protein [Rhabdochlamydiaceae bacterium]
MKRKMVVLFLAFLQFSLWGQESPQAIATYWSRGKFFERDKDHVSKKTQFIKDKTVFFEFNYVSCYGHALLDGLVPLYAMLKAENLLDKSVSVAIRIPSDQMTLPTTQNILQLIKDVFPFKNIYILTGKKKFFFENIILNEYKDNYAGFYKTFPESHNYIKQLKNFGVQDNIVFQDDQVKNNIMKEFVGYVADAYKIKAEMVKNRVLIPKRRSNRKIANLDELVRQLKGDGYDVRVVDFETIPIKEQITQTMQAQYLIGTYGSNLVNAIFLHPEANVVILWHKNAKYFWSRKYCIIHSAFLATGVKLVEFDKRDYDSRDVYTAEISDANFFYRKGSQIFLKPEKTGLEEMLTYPFPAMYEFTNVNMYIPPEEIVQLLEKSKSLNNEPCKLVR